LRGSGNADNTVVNPTSIPQTVALADQPAPLEPQERFAWRWWHAVAIGLLVALALAWLIHAYPMARPTR